MSNIKSKWFGSNKLFNSNNKSLIAKFFETVFYVAVFPLALLASVIEYKEEEDVTLRY